MPKSLTPRPASQNVMIRLSKNQYENKVIRLMDEKGFFTVSETIRFCIEHAYEDLFPAYLERKKNTTANSLITSDEIGAETRKNTLIEKLDAMIIDNERVSFTTFEEVSVGEIVTKAVEMYISEIGPETLRLQYRDALGNTGEEAKNRISGIINKK